MKKKGNSSTLVLAKISENDTKIKKKVDHDDPEAARSEEQVFCKQKINKSSNNNKLCSIKTGQNRN